MAANTKMSPTGAVMAILWADAYQGGSKSRRAADYRRTLRAMDALGITDPDNRAQITYHLDMTDRDGKVYEWLEEALAS